MQARVKYSRNIIIVRVFFQKNENLPPTVILETFSTTMTRKVHVSRRHFGGKTRQPSSFYYGLRQKCRSGGNKLSNVRSSIIFRSKECLIPFNKSNLAIFYGKKGKMKLPGVSNFFWNTRKNLKLNLVFVLILESKGLCSLLQKVMTLGTYVSHSSTP